MCPWLGESAPENLFHPLDPNFTVELGDQFLPAGLPHRGGFGRIVQQGLEGTAERFGGKRFHQKTIFTGNNMFRHGSQPTGNAGPLKRPSFQEG